MDMWDKIAKLAKEMLGDTAPIPTDFSKVEKAVIPERALKTKSKYTSHQEPRENIEVLQEYKFILEALKTGCPTLFVTGKAGTGKSTLIDWLTQQLSGVAVVAPTAIAAVNVRGDTIHSFFGLPPSHIDPDSDFNIQYKKRLVIENLNCLIIDEVSMVLPNIVDAINSILKKVRRSSMPFGGIPVIFVGDLLQLPPVVDNAEESTYFSHRYKTPYFFSADVFKIQKIIPIQLSKVRRQQDYEFIEALSKIRINKDSRDAIAMINRRCYRDKLAGSKEGIYLVPTNAAAKEINTSQLDLISGTLKTYEATVTGLVPLSKWKLTVSDRLELKIGARVLFLKNNKPDWINGDTGIVVGFDENTVRIKKDKSLNIVLLGKERWIKFKYTYNHFTQKIEKEEIGSFEQFPISLGWAITIHKSQGLTLDNIILDLGHGTFATGQLYVALSRAKSIDGIKLAKPIAMKDVKADITVIEFYNKLNLI